MAAAAFKRAAVVLLLLRITLCRDCAYPIENDLMEIIFTKITAGIPLPPPPVSISLLNSSAVCLSPGVEKERYRQASVLAEYSCHGLATCSNGTVIDLFGIICAESSWNLDNYAPNDSMPLLANFSTEPRQDCASCVAEFTADFSDSLCKECSPSCNEGLKWCFGPGPEDCCNYFIGSVCVDRCPTLYTPDSQYNCICSGYNKVFDCGLGFPKLESVPGSGDGSTSGNDGHIVNIDNSYLPWLETTGINAGEVRGCILKNCTSDEILLPLPFPFGSRKEHSIYVSINGILSFKVPFPYVPPLLLPPDEENDIYNMHFIAPYWADNDARFHGLMFWEMYSVGYSPKTDDIISNITDFINYKGNNMEFSGNFVFVANWNEEMHPYPAGEKKEVGLAYLIMNNSYQAVLITDGIKESFAIFTFKCGSLGWSGRATVGFSAGGSYYANHPLSGLQLSNAIACANPNSKWNNIVYDLTSITSESRSISSLLRSKRASGSGSGIGGFDTEDDTDRECNEATIQLVNGDTPDDGRVEICLDEMWGSVCSYRWDYKDARVVCRELGYDGPFKTKYIYGSHRQLLTHINGVSCKGNESNLIKCDHTRLLDKYCTYRPAGVSCHFSWCINADRECNETDVRLVGGQTAVDGPVEICLDGQWSPVCGKRWDYRDAEVVCRQLQYDGPSYPLLWQTRYYSARQHLHDVHCHGNEGKLIECSHGNTNIYSCDGTKAGVICTNTTCEEGAVHLVGGDNVSRGRVLYCYNGTWYSVCADNWDTTGNEARVVCNTLGYHYNYQIPVVVGYGRGTAPILPQSITCRRHHFITLKYCHSTADLDVSKCERVAGVDCQANCTCAECDYCYNNPDCGCNLNCFARGDCCSDVFAAEECYVDSPQECKHGAVRLVGGVTDSTGRLEFCARGVWGRVCNIPNYWGPDNTRVVCRQLGFSDNDYYYTFAYDSKRYGTSERLIVIGEVYCTGTESELLECPHASIGKHHCRFSDMNIFIACYDKITGCEEGNIKLKSGTDSSNGYVEYCEDRRWVGVCSDGWDDAEAKVVCNQLNFESNDGIVIEGPVNTEDGSGFQIQIACNGFEKNLSECTDYGKPPTGDCTIAAVSCRRYSNNSRCTESYGVPDHVSDDELENQLLSYGECSVYESEIEMCNGVMVLGIDRVYVNLKLGNQSKIANQLNREIKDVVSLITDHEEHCVKQVFRVFYHFYLPTCGNITHLTPPSSICQEECQMVQQECQPTWDTVLVALKTIPHMVDCTDASKLLFPVPHCCTGAELYFPLEELESTGSNRSKEVTGNISFLTEIVSGAVVGVVMLFVLMPVVVITTVMVCSKLHKRKQLQKMQLDILPIPGSNTPVTESVNERLMQSKGLHPNKGRDTTGSSTALYNPYIAEPVMMMTDTLEVPMQQVRTSRLPSYHMRELSRGKFLFNSKNIALLDIIGGGEFGIVYKARIKSSDRLVAVKTLKGDFDELAVSMFIEESLKMSWFKHAHVMGLIGVCLDAGSAPYIIMPYMANGSLLKYLKRERKSIVILDETDEDELTEVRKRLMVICSQIASGMEYLADNKYVHRDLAARNCMIDTHFLIKITDFGLSEDVFERNYFRQDSTSGEVVKLPIKWMAPESLSDGHFSEKSDVWSYGVTMWEIFSGGKAPYPGTDPLTLTERLEEGHRLPQPYNAACNKEIFGLMSQCWEKVPENRPTFKELYSNISKFIERIAGYLDMGFNPFTGRGTEEGEDVSKDEMELEENQIESTDTGGTEGEEQGKVGGDKEEQVDSAVVIQEELM